MTIPLVPAMPYGSPIISLPSRIFRQPPEGNRSVPLDIQWSIPLGQATPLKAVSFNLAVAAPQTLSQIVAVTVDNSRCGSDVTLVFPDTDTTLDIPAYEQVTSQVFTGGLSFYAVASNPSTSDETALTVHNFLPPPINLEKSVGQFTNVSAFASLVASESVPIIPAGINGTINQLNVTAIGIAGVTQAKGSIMIQDGATITSISFQIVTLASGMLQMMFLNYNNCSIRFINGLNIISQLSTAYSSGNANAIVSYRTP